MHHFAARLHAAIQNKKTPALVGLDPRFAQLPAEFRVPGRYSAGDPAARTASAYEEFSCRVIDVVAPLVPAVKPQAAFFEECGPAGCLALQRVMQYARRAGLIVICDAKRGDIGTTAEAYARGYLAGAEAAAAPWAADALTVNPYLGRDTLEPFVRTAVERGAGLYVLVRTSNPGAASFQGAADDSRPLYRNVAAVVEELALATCENHPFGIVGAVVGATYPQELAELRAALPHAPLLVPGYGSQGAAAADVAPAFTSDGYGALVNSSRGVIFAWERPEYAARFAASQWEQAVEAAARDMIADLARLTPAGKLVESPPGAALRP